ncbi:MAG: hypothetical protein H6Q69_765 [Firmicutes bacterium]|nr:hypothetical protein [Bacillota bacterium]
MLIISVVMRKIIAYFSIIKKTKTQGRNPRVEEAWALKLGKRGVSCSMLWGLGP